MSERTNGTGDLGGCERATVEEIEDYMMNSAGWLVKEVPDEGDLITGHDGSEEYGMECLYEAHVTGVREDGSCDVYYVLTTTGARTPTEHVPEPLPAQGTALAARFERAGREVEEIAPEATVRIYIGRDVIGPVGPHARELGKIGRDALKGAALSDAATTAGMKVFHDSYPSGEAPERAFVEARGSLGEAREALVDLWRLGFAGYMAETDLPEAEDEISRYHRGVVWDVALVEAERASSRGPRGHR